MKGPKVLILVTIDTECDKGPGWKVQLPMKFRSVTEAVPGIYTPLFDEHGIKPTYLLSPEIIRDQASADTLKKAGNCELGTHLHSEFIEPEAVWEADRTKRIQMDYSAGVEKAKLENLTNLFKETFGQAPTSFRAGRFGMTERGLQFLQELGYTVDSTVSPFKTHYFETGSVRNYWGAPLQPYYPSRHDMRKKGSMSILQVPVSIGNPYYDRLPGILTRRLEDKKKFHKKVMAKLGYAPGISWFRPYRSSFEEMKGLCDWITERYKGSGKPVVLNMMFHSNEVLINGSPYVKNEKEQIAYIDSLNRIFDYLNKEYNCEGVGLSDVKAYF
ncbi:hypothetical protein AB9P05_22955 [Roseivirga sp. BDSF3-8]|uniref:hypothetical protein n=1 Tax=Roseivirga sp. BDSF3-8 TaxID=3241598 RepID=UPI003531F347